MKKLFGILLAVVLVAMLAAAGCGFFSQHNRLSRPFYAAAGFFSPSEAGAHVGGDCYLDDNNLQTVESTCYRKCGRTYPNSQIEVHACEVGCSTAITVATKK